MLLSLALENKLIPQNENYFTSKSLFFFKMFLTLPYRMLNFPQTSPQTRLQDKTNSLTKYLEVIITFLFQQFFLFLIMLLHSVNMQRKACARYSYGTHAAYAFFIILSLCLSLRPSFILIFVSLMSRHCLPDFQITASSQ